MQPFRTALVLGGGGARGLAHVGVLSVLGEAGVPIDMIVGTSMGSIIGGAYALSPVATSLGSRVAEVVHAESLADLERRFAQLGEDEAATRNGLRNRLSKFVDRVRRLYLWNRQAMSQSLLDSALIDELVERLVGDATFDQLAIPFFAVAFDLVENRDAVIGRGRLGPALRASSAIPGVFEPSARGDSLLIDGSVQQEIPVDVARRLGAHFVIAVNVCGTAPSSRPPVTAAETIDRITHVRGEHLRRESCAHADLVITPSVSALHWAEFSRVDECYAAGEAAARAVVPSLKRELARMRRRSALKRMGSLPPAVDVIEVS